MKANQSAPIILKRAQAGNLYVSALEIRPGCTLVHGPMGSGKTTLLRDILLKEFTTRSDQILRPMSLHPDPNFEITNLPASLFLSGEPNLIPNAYLGESLGIFRMLGKILAKSPFRACPTCGQKNKSASQSEVSSKLLADLQGVNPQKVTLKLVVRLNSDDLKKELEAWHLRGFEEIETQKEANSIAIRLDVLTSSELSLIRLKESLVPHLKTGRYLEALALLPDGSQKNFKAYGPNICQTCLTKIPRARPSDFTPDLAIRPNLNPEQTALLKECFVDDSFVISGQTLLAASLTDLKDTQAVFERLEPLCRQIISNLTDIGLGDLKICQPLTEISLDKAFYIQAVKALFIAGADNLVLIDDPIPSTSANINESLGRLITERTQQGGYTLLASNHPDFADYADNFVALGFTTASRGCEILNYERPKQDEPAIASDFQIGLGYSDLINADPSVEVITIKPSSLHHQEGKIFLSVLKIENLLGELLASTLAAKALGLSAKEIIKLDSPSATAKSIKFNNLTFSEILELKIDELLEKFSGIIKLRDILRPISELGLGKIKLNTPLNLLSLQERILVGCLKTYLSKPKRTIIRFQNVLNRLSEAELSTAKNWLKKNLGVTNCIISESVNPTT